MQVESRSRRRHHRARRIAAVSRWFRAQTIRRAYKADEDDGPRHGFVCMLARTRTLCSCGVCKTAGKQRARERDTALAADLRERVAEEPTATEVCNDVKHDGHAAETREMLDEYAALLEAGEIGGGS